MTQKGKAVWIDGTLYVCIAMFLSLQSNFSSEESYKYIEPLARYWLITIVATLGAGAGALKMFRSSTFSESQDEQAIKEGPATRDPKPVTEPPTTA